MAGRAGRCSMNTLPWQCRFARSRLSQVADPMHGAGVPHNEVTRLDDILSAISKPQRLAVGLDGDFAFCPPNLCMLSKPRYG